MKLSKTFLFLTLLTLSRISFALTSDQEYLAKSIYHECREQSICSYEDWQKIAKVAYNRQLAYSVWKFKARCSSIACIVQSKEYTSAKLLNKPIKEQEVYLKIVAFVEKGDFGSSKFLFFSTQGKGKKRKMKYRGDVDNLIGDNK